MKKRVKIPRHNPKEVFELARRVRKKHLEDGDSSLLKVLDWDKLGPLIDEAVAQQREAEELKRRMLEVYQKRSLKLPVILDLLRDSRDVLSGVYKKEMKVLGQWGYDVVDPRSSKSSSVFPDDSGGHRE